MQLIQRDLINNLFTLCLHRMQRAASMCNLTRAFSIAGSPIPPRPSDSVSVRARGRMETTRASPSIADDENLITSTHHKLSRDMFEGPSPEANHTVSPTLANYAGILAVLDSSSISLTREVVPSLNLLSDNPDALIIVVSRAACISHMLTC